MVKPIRSYVMKTLIKLTIVVVITWSLGEASSIRMRRIYSLFTEPKTWNEAASICSAQYGQLVKITGQTEVYELLYLNEFFWGQNLSLRLSSGQTFWSGHHRPLTNSSTVKFQDCEVVSGANVQVDSKTCGHYDINFVLSMASCNERKMFICQRYEDDCWYQPILNERPTATSMTQFTDYGLAAVDCAMICRNYTNVSGEECWAFLYQTEPNVRCRFYIFSDSYVTTSVAAITTTSASAFLKFDSNRQELTPTTSDYVFYVRICFEGSVDMTVYSQYTNEDAFPNTQCATNTYTVTDKDLSNICFCATNEQPPIPKPISSEEKAEGLVRELTIEASNTSAAQRKKISAEDNRPSAVGVGYVGVGLMVGVFGGLFLMDASQLVKGVQQFFRSLK